MMIFMGLSLQDRMALLPAAERQAWIRDQPPWILEEIQRGEWWWVARPEQVPPPGNWLVCLALAGRGYVLENGRVVLSGAGRDLLDNEHVQRAYLGM